MQNSKIEKETIDIIFGVTHFHHYIYGRVFTIMTLHRIQRWDIVLQSYDYDIRYKNTTNQANIDALSTLPKDEDI